MYRSGFAESVGLPRPIPCTEVLVVNTKWNYQRETRATVEDVAEVIRSSVTVGDALRVYCPHIQPKRNRCPCPIHNGDDYNMSFNDRFYKCFVCNASGDVIELVKDVCDLRTRMDAMSQICSDFHLPVSFHTTITKEVSEKVKAAREEAERKKRERNEWEERYQRTLNDWIELDKIIMNTPWDSEENIKKVCKAKEERARIGYKLDLICAEEPR